MTENDIQALRDCQGMLLEIDRLRELDDREQRAIIGRQRLDGMPHNHGGDSGLDDLIERAEDLHERRIEAIDRYVKQVDRCEQILSGIEDITLRVFARAHYVEQIPIWKAAQMVHISVSTANRLKAEMEKRHISEEKTKNETK